MIFLSCENFQNNNLKFFIILKYNFITNPSQRKKLQLLFQSPLSRSDVVLFLKQKKRKKENPDFISERIKKM